MTLWGRVCKTFAAIHLAAFFSLGSFVFPALSAEGCFVDIDPEARDAKQFETRVRVMALSLMAVEFRNSCGIRDETDKRFYTAIKTRVGCADSARFDEIYGHYLTDDPMFVMAVDPAKLTPPETSKQYCQIAERIDLSNAVDADGLIDTSALQPQAPLFFALREIVADHRKPKEE